MKKLAALLALVGLVVFAVVMTATAVDPVIPGVTAVEPASAYNDIGTRVTITGTDFLAGVDDTVTISLGGTPLTDVAWVDTQTLTATVPWGVNAGVYDLTVTNPGGGTPGTMASAFEAKSGIGTWNAGELNGASVAQLLMKRKASPDEIDTLYALA